jgi:hypothetical protein
VKEPDTEPPQAKSQPEPNNQGNLAADAVQNTIQDESYTLLTYYEALRAVEHNPWADADSSSTVGASPGSENGRAELLAEVPTDFPGELPAELYEGMEHVDIHVQLSPAVQQWLDKVLDRLSQPSEST